MVYWPSFMGCNEGSVSLNQGLTKTSFTSSMMQYVADILVGPSDMISVKSWLAFAITYGDEVDHDIYHRSLLWPTLHPLFQLPTDINGPIGRFIVHLSIACPSLTVDIAAALAQIPNLVALCCVETEEKDSRLVRNLVKQCSDADGFRSLRVLMATIPEETAPSLAVYSISLFPCLKVFIYVIQEKQINPDIPHWESPNM
jgi:hypothetical protein